MNVGRGLTAPLLLYFRGSSLPDFKGKKEYSKKSPLMYVCDVGGLGGKEEGRKKMMMMPRGGRRETSEEGERGTLSPYVSTEIFSGGVSKFSSGG